MLQAELRILGGKHQGKAIPLSTKKFLVGREQDCHLRPNSDLVSRHHCVFSIDDYAVRLRDLGSTNGTRVNGKALHGETTLKAGDQIGIGKLELELVIRHRAAAEQTPSAPLQGLHQESYESAAETATVEIPISGFDPNQNSSDTSFELPTQPALAADTSTNLAPDTAIIPGGAQQPQFPAYPAQAPAYQGMPQPGFGAPGYPQQPMGYPQQPMGYPQQPMGYPQQMGYPQMGYPQQPMGYPQGYAMPQYPMQQMPYAGGYAAPAAVEQPAAAQSEAIKLPPPESTGAKAPEPAPGAAPGAPKAAEEKPSNTAADIIKNYMQRRTR
jgi:pSer/pThr/pTyr-binding forkhead associated (FHA) protein